MGDRLQKIIAARGISSRRGAEDLIARGLVTVNGRVAKLGESADPEFDAILIRGVPLPDDRAERYFALHKPTGVVTSTSSTHGERTVIELFPPGERLLPVGRLDKDTSGLLLLTGDGRWANIVTHPRYSVPKEYRVSVRHRPTQHLLDRLQSGVALPGGVATAEAQIHVVEETSQATRLAVTVIEGKKRQIRLMFAAIGHPVMSLQRVRIGAIELGSLPVGLCRPLTESEVSSIYEFERQ